MKEFIYCNHCNKFYTKYYYREHVLSKRHIYLELYGRTNNLRIKKKNILIEF